MEEAVRCSSAWLLSFDKTSTIPVIDYIDTYYDACCWTKRIGIGAVSTEHSVMASNYAVDGDEITFVKDYLRNYILMHLLAWYLTLMITGI